ncbi:hypothetical protein ACHAPB_001859 [Verticillium nonalfalfae]
MKDIGLEGAGISATAISEPFPLFTREAIAQMRAEIFSKDSLENCQYSSSFCKNMIRAMGPAIAPFIYDAWNSPEVLSGISEVAGIEIVPVFDIDIGNVNISFDDQTGTTTGDETAAEQGTAIVLQGRYIEHQALKAFGGSERITMVTSFRARSPFVKDESVLTGVRGISNVSDLYTQYTEYRLEILEDRIRAKRKSENYRAASKRSFDVDEIRVWLETQRQFIDAMLVEIYEVEDGEEE